MSQLSDIGARDGWRCWLCDEPVDPEMSSSDPRGASVDTRVTKAQARKLGKDRPEERLAHVGCNTGKGAKEAVVPWPDELWVIDPAPIIAASGRLGRKGGREVMARCPTKNDADATAAWLVDRMSRLHRDLVVTARVEEGGGQYLVSLCA